MKSEGFWDEFNRRGFAGDPEMHRLWRELHSLQRKVENSQKGRRGAKEPNLRMLIQGVKAARPDWTQKQVAERVDFICEDISFYFPRSWKRVKNPPRTLSKALGHPVLNKRVRSYISRA